MNSSCIDDQKTASNILENGEESSCSVDSKIRLQSDGSLTVSGKDDSICDEANQREGGVNTTGDCPQASHQRPELRSGDMGVAKNQGDTSTGKGFLAFVHGKIKERTDESCISSSANINKTNDCHHVLSNSDIDKSNPQENHNSLEPNTDAANSNLSNSIVRPGQHERSGDVEQERICISTSSKDPTAINCTKECLVSSNDDINTNNGELNPDSCRTSQATNSSLTMSVHSSNSVSCNQCSKESEVHIGITQSSVDEKENELSLDDSRKCSDSGNKNHQSNHEGLTCSNGNANDKAMNEHHLPNQSLSVESECVETGSCEDGETSTMSKSSPHIPNLDDGGRNSNSPATLDVSSEVWEDAQADLPRPRFFLGGLASDLAPNVDLDSQQSSDSTPSSSWSNQSQTPEGRGTSSSTPVQEVSDIVIPTSDAATPEESGNTTNRSRTSTATSLGTDYSSNVSIATEELEQAIADGLVLGEDDIGFEDVSLEQGDYSGHPPGAAVMGSGARPKKKGLGGFLTRNIFRRSLGKSSGAAVTGGAESSSLTSQGWKLFGRVPAKETGPPRDHLEISQDFQKRGQTHPPTSSLSWKKRHTGMKEASSTTALILENRPEYLPAKNPEEEEKHKEEYTKMLKEVKKKELKLYKLRLKKMAQQLKYEDGIKSSLHVWQQEILPRWDEVKKHKKTRDLWWQGVPPSIRGRVWMLAIKNELNITHELFEIFLIRAKDRIRMCSESESEGIGLEEIHAASRENSVDVIKLDVARTFPQLCIFQKGGPYFDLLHSVLGAYACYRPDVGYVQGMSFIAAVFLLYLDVADAFICFANLLNKSCQLAFFRLDQPVMQSYFASFEEYFQDNLPRLFAHFEELGISPDLFIIDWMYTLYSKSLPLDVACRVWDVFFRDGEEMLFRTALGLLSLYEDNLLNMDFIQAVQSLTNIPSNIDSDKLFKEIDTIDMYQKKFGQVLMQHMSSNLANTQGGS